MIDHALQTNSSSGADTTQTIPNRQARRTKKPETSAFCGQRRSVGARCGNSTPVWRNKCNTPPSFVPPIEARRRLRRESDTADRGDPPPFAIPSRLFRGTANEKRGAPFGTPRPSNSQSRPVRPRYRSGQPRRLSPRRPPRERPCGAPRGSARRAASPLGGCGSSASRYRPGSGGRR